MTTTMIVDVGNLANFGIELLKFYLKIIFKGWHICLDDDFSKFVAILSIPFEATPPAEDSLFLSRFESSNFFTFLL